MDCLEMLVGLVHVEDRIHHTKTLQSPRHRYLPKCYKQPTLGQDLSVAEAAQE